MPLFEVDGKGGIALASCRVDVACRVAIDTQNGNNSVRRTVSTLDVRRCGSVVVIGQRDAAGRLGEGRASLVRFEDAFIDVVSGG